MDAVIVLYEISTAETPVDVEVAMATLQPGGTSGSLSVEIASSGLSA